MPRHEQIDSPNPAGRAIERWKRGLAVAVLMVLGALPGFVAAALGYYAGELAGSGTVSVFAGVFAFLAFAPWGIGQRSLMRQIGELAEVDDR